MFAFVYVLLILLPVRDEMKTMDPLVFSRCGNACLVMMKQHLTFRSKLKLNISTGVSRIGMQLSRPPPPALHTIESSPENVC
jgi:hypothetical protein